MREGVFGDGDGGDTGLIGATAENGKWLEKDCLESFLYFLYGGYAGGGIRRRHRHRRHRSNRRHGGKWKMARKGLLLNLFVYP